MRLAIIIPALNEAGNIRRLMSEIPTKLPLVSDIKVIVVDNGSTDSTADEARDAGAIVVKEPQRGYGYACAAGLRASEKADVLVFMDGDGSFDPAEMTVLVRPIAEGLADLVFGSRAIRTEPGAMPPHQRFGNRLVSRLMRLLYGLKVTDLAPYRAIRRDHLFALGMQEMTFGWPTEMMVKAARCNYRIAEVSVSYRKRWSGQSKVSGTLRGTVLATYFILGVTLRYAFAPNRSSKLKPRR
jgi:glycosyltransferase involved in cell wall biosynthesis